jgi:predicted nucleic acid-binding protein
MAGRVTPVVVDANLTVALAAYVPYSQRATQLMEGWQRDKVPLYAPLLWEYELTTAMRKTVALGALSEEKAIAALERLLSMGVRCIPPDVALHRAALQLAGQLAPDWIGGYDAQYLAVAARLGADFWTADRRLAECAQAAGLDWVHCVSSAGEA